ncbi:PREDICTED: pentatricopeptide repeat-containing protein At5g50990 [Lupinus angustifolius]|uniref:pentatricopeptide repeat-containing protein At5g50990 n=1 Tax=Lupinus angustifolius TaxID=3871 RepID=UPI00092F0FB5|nr:PREDICTED: pentatricopeptide repeat-containing protein At5g50990 [Lupinus angustifolius]
MERIMMKVQRLRYSPYNFPSFSHSWRNPNCFIHSLSSSPSHHSSLTDHRVLHRVLQRCKVSMDFKTVGKTHARIIVLGYVAYPSLVASLISTYARCQKFHISHQVLRYIISHVSVLFKMNIIIENLVKVGECDIAKKLFDKMSVRDVVTWNTLIGGYVKNSRFLDALRIFKGMLNAKVEPDGFTFASVITGCARLGALGNAKWVHALMAEKRIELNYILSAALIDMYAKCGRIDVSKQVFKDVKRDHVSVWNAMINGLASHGLALDATVVFSRMELENVLPDYVTFIGILAACSHAGLVEEGRKYFDMMHNRFLIQPQLEHYGTMVDLLGRSGLLEDAYAMIKAMPMEPDVVIWRALLSACRTHRKKELGEIAIAKISHAESGDFVLLSNMYCSLNNWSSAERVRQMMKKGGVHKKRGKSWIELGDSIHQFKAADQSHAEMKAIYRVLEGLIQRAKLEGFTPLTDLVLMDVSEEEKEENLSFHSEKLALAYGVLKSSPGTKIRIFKNLRICQDCHNWMKILSTILQREIIVRDRIRFHQFEGGFCSCGDYW